MNDPVTPHGQAQRRIARRESQALPDGARRVPGSSATDVAQFDEAETLRSPAALLIRHAAAEVGSITGLSTIRS